MRRTIGFISALGLLAGIVFFAPSANAAVVCNGYGCYVAAPPVVIAPAPMIGFRYHSGWWRWHRRHW